MNRAPILTEKEIKELADRLRQWHQFDAQRSPKAERVALRKIMLRLQAGVDVIDATTRDSPDIAGQNANRAAWLRIHALSRPDNGPAPLVHAGSVQGILTEWIAAAARAVSTMPKTRHPASASPMIADSVVGALQARRATVSSTAGGVAVRELQRVYKAAQLTVTPAAAVKAIKAALKRQRSQGRIQYTKRRE